jgi:glycosyltransferase involved in cell wall biosynthesis
MNILLINHYAGSPSLGMEFRPYYMANEWQKCGHNVLIVAASNSHVRSKQFQLKQNFEKHNIEGVNYLILKTPQYEGNTIKRIINIITFVWQLFKHKKMFANEFKPDVVITSSTYPFDIYPGKKIAKISGAKLIYEVHDLWPLSPMEFGGYSRWHPFIMTVQRAENFAYKYTDKVISMLPKAKEYMVAHGLKPEKFVYIPNGIMVKEWDVSRGIPDRLVALIQMLKKQNKTLIGYAGSHGLANALDSLLDAMKILENENVDLLLIGHGPEKERLIQRSKKMKLQNTHFINSVSKTLIPSLLDKLDILYIGLQKQPSFRFGISPNKLIDYMMAGRPVIQAIKAGNDMVSEAECGISIEPENPDAIADAVRYLISQPKETLKEMGEQGKKYCIANHDYKILAKKFLEVLK